MRTQNDPFSNEKVRSLKRTIRNDKRMKLMQWATAGCGAVNLFCIQRDDNQFSSFQYTAKRAARECCRADIFVAARISTSTRLHILA